MAQTGRRGTFGDWIYVRVTGGCGAHESWYSPTKDVSAIRSDSRIEFRDHGSAVEYSFDMREQVLYRVPEYQPRRSTDFLGLAESVQQAFRAGGLPDDPMNLLAFMGPKPDEIHFTGHSLRRTEDDRSLEYRITFQRRGTPDIGEYVFRLDDALLLRTMHITGTWDGKQHTQAMEFEYPACGPGDVYALGVPRSAKLVDRTLPKEIQQVDDALRLGRRLMDNYRAIVVPQFDYPKGIGWLGERNMIIYRNGDKFRVDTAHWFGGLFDYAMVEKPAGDTDMAAWWRQRVDVFMYFPFYLDTDAMVYHVQARVTTDSDANEYWEAESVDARKEYGKPGDLLPAYYSRMPEFVCRPPLGIPSENREATLTPAADGPQQTILLEVRASGRMPTCNGPSCDTGQPQPNLHRFWLDPSRDFVVVRFDMVFLADSGEEELVHSMLIEELAQSPGGTWYARRMRTKAVPPVEYDEVFDFYLDFDFDVPDSLFEPPKVGQRLS
jgi:hypothetical protein